MPELPEVEITARLIGEEVAGARIESAAAPGLNTLRGFEPPLSAFEGERLSGIGRRGKMPVIECESGAAILIHLMSAGRLQLHRERAPARDRTSRLLLGLEGGGEIRLREFGTRQRAWAKPVAAGGLDDDPAVAALGPEAWPDPPPIAELVDEPRPLYSLLRDQRLIAGIGRSWVDEILWTAELSPFLRGNRLSGPQAEALGGAIAERIGGAIGHYERELSLPIPDRLPMPLSVHGREGEPCPRCGAGIAAVHYESYVLCYCPAEQTGGKVLKDRRLSRLLK